MYFGQYLSHSTLHTYLSLCKDSIEVITTLFCSATQHLETITNIYSHELIIKIYRGDKTEKKKKKKKKVNRKQKKGR